MEYYMGMYSASTPIAAAAAAAAAAMLGIVVLLLIFRRHSAGRSGKHLPPTVPFALPIIGHMPQLMLSRRPLYLTLGKLCAKYGPVLYLRLGIRRLLVVYSPSVAEECLTKNDIVFANRMSNLLVAKQLSYDYDSLLYAPYGPLWRELRRFSTTELFSAARTSGLSCLRAAETEAVIGNLVNSAAPVDGEGYRRVNVMMLMREVVFNILTQMVVGKRYLGDRRTEKAEEGKKFYELVIETIELNATVSMEDLLPAVKWLGINKFKKRMESARTEFDTVLQGLLDGCRKQQRLDKSNKAEEEERKSLLDTMVSLQEEESEQMYTDTVIKGTVLSFIAGGTDAPSNNMEWQVALLLKHPQVLEKVRAEIDAHVGHDRLITDSDLPKLPYLTNVVKESLRLYPAGRFLVAHEASADCTVAGYDVPKGTVLLVNVHGIQRDPSLWEDPDSFMPERWSKIDQEERSIKFLPFGYGRRICPAELMSMRMMALVVGAFVQCFEFKMTSDEVDMSEADRMIKAIPLEVDYKPRQVMMPTLSRIF